MAQKLVQMSSFAKWKPIWICRPQNHLTLGHFSRDVPDIRFQMAGYPAVFLLSGSGSGPVVPRNRISEPDNSSAQMWAINLKLKAAYNASWETHLRATGRHLPYGITQPLHHRAALRNLTILFLQRSETVPCTNL